MAHLSPSAVTIHTGRILSPIAPPSGKGPGHASLKHFAQGALAVDDLGVIIDCGEESALLSTFPHATIIRHSGSLLLPGFIDTHLHFPQLDIIGCYGEKLLGWLERYTFPTEIRFTDGEHARRTASRFVTEMLANGTTLGCIFSTSHKESTEALFEECDHRGVRAVIGKVGMDRHAPQALLHPVSEDQAASEELIGKWHGKDDRLHYALTPRFAPCCSREILTMYGELAKRHPDVFIQTHHSESDQEIAWVAELFPESKNYLDVYERFGLLGPKTILAHSIHSTDEELARMAEIRPMIAHCPTSNMFLGSGLFPMSSFIERNIPITLASDIGGGTSISMWRTMAAAYEVQRLKGSTIPPAGMLWLSTLASAEALGFGRSLGSLDKGKFADFQVIKPGNSRLLDHRFRNDPTPEEQVFALAFLADDRIVEKVFVRGREVHSSKSISA